jgi:hypothetical protein
MNKNYVHTLAFNLTSEVEKATELLYSLNDHNDFRHVIVDLGFPLNVGDEIPKNIKLAKQVNTIELKRIANEWGSLYLKLDNVGVSQNWSMVFDYFNMDDSDILCCADPDEHPITENWVRAIGNVIRADPEYAWVSLTMPEHQPIFNPSNTIEKIVGGERIFEIIGNLNWAQGGFSGQFLKDVGGIPNLDMYPIYGGIESASIYMMEQLEYKWCMLPEYIVDHTDYEKGSKGSSKLLREWKNFIIYQVERFGQLTLEEYLQKRITGEIEV